MGFRRSMLRPDIATARRIDPCRGKLIIPLAVTAFLLGSFLFPTFASADPLLTPRALDSIAADALKSGMSASRTMRRLVATLEISNVVVHILSSQKMPANLRGATHFVSSSGGYRYVRITIAALLHERAQVAILAHELQHACEIAASAANDHMGVRRLFEESNIWDRYYDTRGAIDTERAVLMELSRRHLRSAE